jgi:hypothetical protein
MVFIMLPRRPALVRSLDRRVRLARAARVASALTWLALVPMPATAQQSLGDTLSFLLTNRSISTDEFVQDEQVAAATRDTISESLLNGLSTLPIGSSTSGFTYRVEPGLGGIVQRSSSSFGSFFTERSLTVGRQRGSFGFAYQHASFNMLDGQSLTDGTLVATASTLIGETEPFDVETLTLRMRMDSVTVTGTYGVSDRLDIGAALPLVSLRIDGERVDIYRNRRLLQASATATASGIGDLALRVKYNLIRAPGGGLAIGAEARLPTGDEENLLGSGETSLEPRIIWSVERGRLAIDTDFGYSFGGLSGQLGYGAAFTYIGLPRLMLVGELSGAWIDSVGHLTQTTSLHPRLVGVRTIRLSAADGSSGRLLAVAGVKWNPTATWLVSGSLLRRLTTDGLTASWVPTLALEYAFGG